jgi:hypothetical protein
MAEGILLVAYIAFLIFLVFCFLKMVFDVSAIRRMLENTGLFSGVPCGWCHMPIPTAATAAVTAAGSSPGPTRPRISP